MPYATIDIVETDPQQYTPGGGEESDEEIGAVGSPKDTRRPKIEWEKYKDLLRKLYMEEDKPLPAVMKIMKGFGLYATTKQWYVSKKNKFQSSSTRNTLDADVLAIGEKWKWKKYNQGVVKLTPPRTRKSRSQNNLTDVQEDEIIVASNGAEIPCRDLASLHTSLLELFTDQPLDEKCLSILKIGNPRDVSQCLRLCFHWCKEEIHVDDAEFPAPYGDGTDAEIGIPEDNYGCDVRIFIYLLHRYIGSSALAEHDSWDTLAKQTVGFCPIKMLYTMSTLVVVVVGSALKLSQEEADPYTPPSSLSNDFHDLFSVAKLGVDEMDRWEDEKLLTEFCDEFGTILEDYANYGDAISSAVRKYTAQNWPGLDVPEELGFASDEDHHDDPGLDIYMPDDDMIFSVEDISM
ncbi:hypothetical protein F4782DRAFT_545366 [Xylaria castorea]|nr:hypothetical protein F4782DRAFT_545366 [Xylaria castorea]